MKKWSKQEFERIMDCINAIVDSSSLGAKDAAAMKVQFREDLEPLFRGLDGRAESWGDERRLLHGIKMRESWRRRGVSSTILCYAYRDKPPREYDFESAAAALGVEVATLRGRFYRNRHGFIRRTLRGPEIWTRSAEGYDLLRASKAVHGEPYQLPRSPKSKTF